MRVGVVSDTHGRPEFFRKALEQMGNIDLLIHAGDNYRDAIAISKESGIPVEAVTGNCDWQAVGPEEKEIELEGYRILITHGHAYGVKTDTSLLTEKLKNGKYDIVIFGHSHKPEIVKLPQGYLFNPGSVAVPRGGSQRSFGILEIDKKGIVPYIYELNWQS